MGVYRRCPTCGNTGMNDPVYVCNDCRHMFCGVCGNKEFDTFPLPFTTMHCPRCKSTKLRGVGVIDPEWRSGW